MIQINLLPVRTKKKREAGKRFASIYFATVFLMIGAVGYVWYSQKSEIERLTEKSAKIEREISKYAKFDALLKDLTKRKELIDKKRAVADNLQKDRDAIVRILALLSVQVPNDKIWFERLSQASNTITLNGIAQSNEAVVEFMRNLEASPYIQKGSVNLIHSRQSLISDMKLREFQITYRFFPFSEIMQQAKEQG